MHLHVPAHAVILLLLIGSTVPESPPVRLEGGRGIGPEADLLGHLAAQRALEDGNATGRLLRRGIGRFSHRARRGDVAVVAAETEDGQVGDGEAVAAAARAAARAQPLTHASQRDGGSTSVK